MIEVRCCIEIGEPDGSTHVRVLHSETVLKPTVRQTTSEDMALLMRAAMERINAEVLEHGIDQCATWAAAMAGAQAEEPLAFDDEGLPPAGSPTEDFVHSFDPEIQQSKHFGLMVHRAAQRGLTIGNVTREAITVEVRRMEAEDPTS